MGRDGGRDCFREVSWRASLEATVVIGARFEPTLDVDEPVSDMPADLQRLRAIASRSPAVDRCERDRE